MTAAAATQSASMLISASWQPQAHWQSQTGWTVLDTGFGCPHNFLALWQCWRTHASAPAILHCVGVLSLAEALQLPDLLQGLGTPDAARLAGLCYDLEPGCHRLLLEHGQVSLTLCVGDTVAMLDKQHLQADSVLLACPALPWDKWQLKSVARCCKRGAELLFAGPVLPGPTLLSGTGFDCISSVRAVYNPRWQLRPGRHGTPTGKPPAGRCAIIGAGIAGASVARALALRGFQVDVYDTDAEPAGGASGLPLGLVVPHHSADDSPRSRMSRSGTRLMLQHADALLQAGQDWMAGGVLERAIAVPGLTDAEADMLSGPAAMPSATAWARPMVYGDSAGLWHPHAAWIKPAVLVQRWLDHPRIRFHGLAAVHTLERNQGLWLLYNATGQALGCAERVVFANAHGCVDLVLRLARRIELESAPDFPWVADVLGKLQAMQRMYGTLSFGHDPAASAATASHEKIPSLPAFPVNGHGSFAAGIPTQQGPHWYAGATFQSDASRHADLGQEHAANERKLQALLPAAARALETQFAQQQVHAWQGSRCISHDRLPLVGPLEASEEPTLWLCAGMGARGLSFSALCAELLAAYLCGEPLPLESNLVKSLDTRRPRRTRAPKPAPS